jgi:hypothetical protein
MEAGTKVKRRGSCTGWGLKERKEKIRQGWAGEKPSGELLHLPHSHRFSLSVLYNEASE